MSKEAHILVLQHCSVSKIDIFCQSTEKSE